MTHQYKHFPVWIIPVLVLCLFFFNLFATYFHLYFFIWWLDIPVHIFGGLWVGLLSLVLYYHSDYVPHKEHSVLLTIAIALSSALVIGLMWEIYEFVVDRAMEANEMQLGDALKDLCDDLLGGIIAAVIFIRKGYNKHI